MEKQNHCVKCGKELLPHNKYCINCGEKINKISRNKLIKYPGENLLPEAPKIPQIISADKSKGRRNSRKFIICIIFVSVFIYLISGEYKTENINDKTTTGWVRDGDTLFLVKFSEDPNNNNVNDSVQIWLYNVIDKTYRPFVSVDAIKATFGDNYHDAIQDLIILPTRVLDDPMWEGKFLSRSQGIQSDGSVPSLAVKSNIIEEDIENKKDEANHNNIIQENENSLPNIKDIINNWEKRIFKITCYFMYADTLQIVAIQQGSGFLSGMGSDEYMLITNKHVVRSEGHYEPQYCDIESSDKSIQFKADNQDIRTSHNFDTAGILIKTNKVIGDNNFYQFCNTNKIEIGTDILILGYPGIGAQTGITATEGIISGIEDYYFVTSAKIDSGNSGGAAISIENNCYIGIPTAVDLGVAESLGRILNFRKTMAIDTK